MRVKVLKPWTGTRHNRVGEIINVPDNLVKAWTEGGWVAPVENKLMPPPSENKASDVAEQGKEAPEPSGDDKPVRRKIKHRKKAGS
jgi:hypothetical protein